MLRRLRERTENEQGFTLIELLVVILIIGILAAIAIPSFLNQRGKGSDAEAKSAVVTAAEAMETCATDNNGSYTPCIEGVVGPPATGLIAVEPTLADAAARMTVDSTLPTNGYTIGVASDRDTPVAPVLDTTDVIGPPATGVVFQLRRLGNGTTERSCNVKAVGPPSNGGCKPGVVKGW